MTHITKNTVQATAIKAIVKHGFDGKVRLSSLIAFADHEEHGKNVRDINLQDVFDEVLRVAQEKGMVRRLDGSSVPRPLPEEDPGFLEDQPEENSVSEPDPDSEDFFEEKDDIDLTESQDSGRVDTLRQTPEKEDTTMLNDQENTPNETATTSPERRARKKRVVLTPEQIAETAKLIETALADAGGTMPKKDIVAALAVDETTVDAALKSMKDAGNVTVKLGRNASWSLAAK